MPDLTDITFLLDRSGSMHAIQSAVTEGFEDFLADRRREAGECRISLFRFNDRCEEVYSGLPLAQVPALDLEPFGNTALLDAIGDMVHATRYRLAAMPERPDTVIIGIITDGQDNRSHRYSRTVVSDLIETQESVAGWEFYYLGANQDAIEVGQGLGVEAGRSLTYAPGKVDIATKALSKAVGRSRDAAGPEPGFSDAEREDAG